MAADDKRFFMIAGCVFLTAAAVFVLVGVAPPVGSPEPAAPTIVEDRQGTIASAGDAGPRAPRAVPARHDAQTGGDRATAGESHWSAGGDPVAAGPGTEAEWLTASLGLDGATGEPSGSGAALDRLEAIISAAAEGQIPDGEAGWRLPWDRVLVRDTSDGSMVLAAGTFRHYDACVAALEQVDLERLVAAVAALDNDGVTTGIASKLRQAVRHALALEVPDTPAEMESHVTRWVFADDSSRQLGPIHKHLLLMGPAHAAAVQARLRKLEGLLDQAAPATRPALEMEQDRPSSEPPLLASNEPGDTDERALAQVTAE